ncbi:MAG: hypothetical protein K2K12_06675, partial [Clostridia bacterium]|nr:hypothetical protein [Clostridia bacterium]
MTIDKIKTLYPNTKFYEIKLYSREEVPVLEKMEDFFALAKIVGYTILDVSAEVEYKIVLESFVNDLWSILQNPEERTDLNLNLNPNSFLHFINNAQMQHDDYISELITRLEELFSCQSYSILY